MNNLLFYFGCRNNKPGHYLWHGSQTFDYRNYRSRLNFKADVLGCLDGTFILKNAQEGQYAVSHLPGLIIIAWPDYSVDGRPGSNSVLVAATDEYKTVEQVLDAAKSMYPDIMARQKGPLTPARYLTYKQNNP